MGNADVGQKPLEYLLSAMTLKRGRLTARMVLKVLAPKGLDPFAGSDLRLVRQRQKPILCTHVACGAAFAEFKELSRHVRTAHALPVGVRGVHACQVPGCNRSYATRGWLASHMRRVHAG
jgi:uncharacterized C2H2 Zn-finger protein